MANKIQKSNYDCQEFENISGEKKLDKIIEISQSPIGRTPRSNPVTYTGIFTPIRELFSETEEARARGYKPEGSAPMLKVADVKLVKEMV